jgi:hypothetical protein
MSKSYEDQAEIAFHMVSDMYKISKFPQENDDEVDYLESTSVYEQLGFLKFLEPNVDLRGLVLCAIYFVKNGYITDIDAVFSKKYGTKIPDCSGFGFKGNNTNVEIIFVKKEESWFDLGCKMFTKYV